MRTRTIVTAAVVLLLVAVSVEAAEMTPPSDRVAVLDAGTFVVVEAHHATLGEALAALGTRLGITLENTDRVDLARVVDGRRSGSLIEIVRWLAPDQNFVLLYEERRPNDPRPPRIERIGFLDTGKAPGEGTAAPRPMATAPPENMGRDAVVATPIVPVPRAGGGPRSGAPAGGGGLGEDLRDDGSKPELSYTPMSEIKSVAEQLRAATPAAQLQIERDARAPDRIGAPPEFLRPQSDAAQTTLQQQAQRSQALAVEQLQALMEAFKAICRSAKGGGPC